jgi:hypothetical protein
VVVNAPLAVALILATHLAMATTAAAQVDEDEPPPAPIPSRIEIGGVAGLMAAFPEVGLLASVPTGPDSAFEITVGWMPAVIFDHENAIAQAQVRLPFKPHLRSRKSLILGVTRIKAQRDGEGIFGGSSRDNDPFVRPHAGVSLQWPMGRNADLRFDAQGLFTFNGELPLLPRVTTTFVWHSRRAGTAHRTGRAR